MVSLKPQQQNHSCRSLAAEKDGVFGLSKFLVLFEMEHFKVLNCYTFLSEMKSLNEAKHHFIQNLSSPLVFGLER